MALVVSHRQGLLYDQLASTVHLIRFAPGAIEFRPDPAAPRDLAGRLGQFLQEATGQRWVIGVGSRAGPADPAPAAGGGSPRGAGRGGSPSAGPRRARRPFPAPGSSASCRPAPLSSSRRPRRR